MKRIEHFDFSKEFGTIDDSLIEEAGRSWDKKKVPLYRRYGMRIATAFIILAGAVSIFSIPDVQADIWKFSTKIGEVLGIKNDLQPYVKVVNQSKSKNGITVQLNEVILDENCLLFSIKEDIREYLKKFEQEMSANGISNGEYPQISFTVNGEKTKINGQTLEYYKSGVYLNLGNCLDDGDLCNDINSATNAVQEEVMELRFQNIDYFSENSSKVIRVDTVIEAINADEDWAEPLATFDYSFYISKDQIQAMTKKKDLHITVSLGEDKELGINKLIMNRIESKIEAKMNKEAYQKYENSLIKLAFRGEDDKGNAVQYNFAQYDEDTETLLFETDFNGMMEFGVTYEGVASSLAIPDDEAGSLNLQLYEVTYDEEILHTEDENENDSDSNSKNMTNSQDNVIGGADGETGIAILDEGESGVEGEVDEGMIKEGEGLSETDLEEEDVIYEEESIITGEHWNPVGEKFTIELEELR